MAVVIGPPRNEAAAALAAVAPPSVLDQDAAHQPSGDGEEVAAVVPVDFARFH